MLKVEVEFRKEGESISFSECQLASILVGDSSLKSLTDFSAFFLSFQWKILHCKIAISSGSRNKNSLIC